MKTRFNHSGYSLIEISIALGITGVVALSLMLASQLGGDSRSVNIGKSNRTRLMEMIANQLSFREQCRSSFRVNTAAPVKLNLASASTLDGQEITLNIRNLEAGAAKSEILQKSTGAIPDGGTLLGQRLQIETVRLYSLSNEIMNLGANKGIRRAYLRIGLSVNSNSSSGAALGLNWVPISVMLSLDGTADALNPTVTDCYNTQFQSLKEICLLMGGDYRSTQNPPCRFRADPMTCPAGQVWTGVVGGIAQCTAIGGNCANGQLMSGFGVNSVNCFAPTYSVQQ